MSKRLILVLAAAFVVGLAFAAYAEVQNVKVSGDLLIRGVGRDNLDLSNSGTLGDKENDQGTLFMSTVRVKVDADLTDNVAVTVRLLNERAWDQEDTFGDTSELNLDLAYATMKEFLYSPLTLIVGRQPLRVGNALIIGDPDTNRTSVNVVQLPAIVRDLSARKAFDAIRANLNYDPLVIDLVYAKGYEGTVTRNEDIDVYGILAKYDLDKKTAIEPYFVVKSDHSGEGTVVNGKSDKIYDIGATLYASPIENLKTSLEGSYQFGHYNIATANNKSRRAYAIQAMADYVFANRKYTPGVGLSYTYLSGDKSSTDNHYTAWDPMFEDQTLNSIPNLLFVNSNMQVVNVKANLKPKEDITLSANYGYYRLAQKVTGNLVGYDTWSMSTKKSLGSALDLSAAYDYTEDVQLALDFGWFKPGPAFDTVEGKRDATSLIGSMKVTF